MAWHWEFGGDPAATAFELVGMGCTRSFRYRREIKGRAIGNSVETPATKAFELVGMGCTRSFSYRREIKGRAKITPSASKASAVSCS